MRTSKYEKLKNNTIIASYFVLIIFLSLYGYLSYYFDKLSFNKLIILLVTSLLPLLITIIINISTKSTSKYIKYFILFGFAFTLALVTFITKLEYMYIFSILMLILLVIYQDEILLILFSFYISVVTFTSIYLSVFTLGFNEEFIIAGFIKLFSVIFTAIIIDLLCQNVKYTNDVTAELSEYILRDRLTGAFNRNFIIDNIIFDKKSKNGISLAFIDIDDFKYLNDNYGHDYGDMVLQQFASIIMNKLATEKNVFLIRIGGDEFLIISIDMEYTEFIKVVENIKEKIIKTTFTKNKINTYIKISVGITSTNECANGDFDELYKKADERLYLAKRQGKNQVVYK